MSSSNHNNDEDYAISSVLKNPAGPHQHNNQTAKRPLTRSTSREITSSSSSSLVSRPVQERRLTRQLSRNNSYNSEMGIGSNCPVPIRNGELLTQHPSSGARSPQLLRKERGISRTLSQEVGFISTSLQNSQIVSGVGASACQSTFSTEKVEFDQLNRNDEEKLPILLAKLRVLLQDYPKSLRRDDEFLAKFIRVRDYDENRAFDGVKKYYHYVHKYSDLTFNIRPRQFEELFKDEIVIILNGRCKRGSKVGLFQARAWDTNKHKIRAIQQSNLLVIEEGLHDKLTQVNGVSLIFDLTNLSFAHARQITPKVCSQLVLCAQDGFPMRVIALHFVNYPSIFWGIFYIAQGFMKEKLRKRVHFHNNFESLHQHFYVESLPKCIGGQLEQSDSIDVELYENMLRTDKVHEEYYTTNLEAEPQS